MIEQRERDIESLVRAAREILGYVSDPDERPWSHHAMTTLSYPRSPKSPAQIARENADRLESQSRAVRDLERELEKWPQP